MKYPSIMLLTVLAFPAFAAEAPPRNENTVVLDGTGVQNLGVEYSPAEEAAFERSVFVLGQIDHTCESHAVLSSRVPGRITEVFVHKGEIATKGQVVARLESRQPGNPPPVIELKAPGGGLVIGSETHPGAPVEPDMKLMTILDLTRVWVIAKVPQHQASILKEGLTARVRVPALGEEERVAKYLQPGVNADPAMGTIDAVFELPNPGNRMRPGMRAELSLIVGKRDGVLSVPREALQGDASNRFVFIRDYELEHAFVRVPVTLGETSGERVEIIAGLFPGDEVVTRGAYALSFAGKGSASLKEALDAAHGHPHNEDGSEMSDEEIQAAADGGGHRHDHDARSPLVLFLAIACGVLFLLLLASVLANRKQPPKPA